MKTCALKIELWWIFLGDPKILRVIVGDVRAQN